MKKSWVFLAGLRFEPSRALFVLSRMFIYNPADGPKLSGVSLVHRARTCTSMLIAPTNERTINAA